MKSCRLQLGRIRWRRVAALVVVSIVVLAWLAVRAGRVERWASSQLEAELERAVGRRVAFGRIHFSSTGIVLDQLRLLCASRDCGESVSVRHATIALAWWPLLRAGDVRVQSVALDGLDVLESPGNGERGPRAAWQTQLFGLATHGLERITVHDGSVRVESSEADGRWVVSGIQGMVALHPAALEYRIDAGSLVHGSLGALALHTEGRADPVHVTVANASARIAGGTVGATAQADLATNETELHVTGRGLSPRLVAANLGLPPPLVSDATLDGEGDVVLHGQGVDHANATVQFGTGSVLQDGVRWGWDTANAEVWIGSAGDTTVTADFHAKHARTAQIVDGLEARRILQRGAMDVQEAVLVVRARGTLSALSMDSAEGHLRLTQVRVRPTPGVTPVLIPDVDTDIRQSQGYWRFRNLRVRARDFEIDGQLAVNANPGPRLFHYDARGDATASDVTAIRHLFPRLFRDTSVVDALPAAAAAVHFHATGSLSALRTSVVDGHIVAQHFRRPVRFPLPAGQVLQVPLERATGSFHHASDGTLSVQDLRIDGPMGTVVGTARLSPGGYQLSVSLERGDPNLVRWLVPGTVSGGELHATLGLDGCDIQPVRWVTGEFELRNAQYVAPPELDLAMTPIAVSRFGGSYRWQAGIGTLSDLRLRSDVVDGTAGRIIAERGLVRITGMLTSRNVGRASDFWPALRGLIRGGTGAGRVEVSVMGRAAQGRLSMVASGGAVILPRVPAEFATQAIDHGLLDLEFEPGTTRINRLALRGVRANVDASGGWHYDGSLLIRGTAWLSPAYSRQLMGGWQWLAGLLGHGQIGSDFVLDGSAAHALLHAGITKGLFWGLARSRVSADLRDVLQGKTALQFGPNAAVVHGH